MTTARLAFDRLAPTYDTLAAGHAFQQQRQQTHAAFARWIRPGFRVLEIGCGTGADTEFFAKRGVRVVACDPSEEMLSRTKRRLTTAGLGDRVGILSCGLKDVPQFLDALDHAEGFDAVVSNFGALNCASSLDPLGVIGCRHLRAGGAFVIGLMGRTCLWETLYFTLRGDGAGAARRRVDQAEVPVAGIDVPTFYHRIADVRNALGTEMVLQSIEGIGVAIPPPYLEPRWQQLPRTVRGLVTTLDSLLAPFPPFNRVGDHVLLQFVKRGGRHA